MVVDLVASTVVGSASWDTTIVLIGRVPSGAAPASLLVLFGMDGSGRNGWFAGLDITGELSGGGPSQVIGRVINGVPSVELWDEFDAVTGHVYRLQVDTAVISDQVQVTLTVDDATPIEHYASTATLHNSRVGAGGVGCDVEILHYGIGSCGL